MDCKEFRTIVADLFDKEVSLETQKACSEHLSHCAECREYYEGLQDAARLLHPRHSPVRQEHGARSRRWLQVAAMFVGILFASGIALAAIQQMRHAQPQASEQTAQADTLRNAPRSSSTVPEDSIPAETHVFDNVAFDEMLNEIARHYQAEVVFQNDEVRQLRFYFVWYQEQPLDKVVEALNHFERINIELDDKKLTVR